MAAYVPSAGNRPGSDGRVVRGEQAVVGREAVGVHENDDIASRRTCTGVARGRAAQVAFQAQHARVVECCCVELRLQVILRPVVDHDYLERPASKALPLNRTRSRQRARRVAEYGDDDAYDDLHRHTASQYWSPSARAIGMRQSLSSQYT